MSDKRYRRLNATGNAASAAIQEGAAPHQDN